MSKAQIEEDTNTVNILALYLAIRQKALENTSQNNN